MMKKKRNIQLKTNKFIKKPSLIGFIVLIILIGKYYVDQNNIVYHSESKELQAAEVRVIDGDSLVLDKIRIRMQGIDAPELKQECIDTKSKQVYKCGEVSKKYLMKLIGKQLVKCTNEGIDRYQRQLSYCYVGNINLNREMVRSGNAVAYKRYDKSFIKEEIEAKENNKGIWASKFEGPEQFRKAKLLAHKNK